MRLFKAIFLLSLSITLYSCKNNIKHNNSSQNSYYHVNIDSLEMREIYTSNIFGSVKPIILETKEECIIGSIDKFYANDKYIFILDFIYAKSLFIFDKEGTFVRKIGCFGNGPGEYSSIYDFTISEKDKVIYLLDANKGKILTYNYETGQFIKDLKFISDLKFYHIQFIDGKLFADAYSDDYFNKSNQYVIQVFDINTQKKICTWLDCEKDVNGWNNNISCIQNNPFRELGNGKFYYTQEYMNPIFIIDNNDIRPYISINGKDIATNSEIKKYKENYIKSFTELKKTDNPLIWKIVKINDCIEHNNFIFFSVEFNKDISYVFINKSTHEEFGTNFILDDLVFFNNKINDKEIIIWSKNIVYSNEYGVYTITTIDKPCAFNPKDYSGHEIDCSDIFNPALDKCEELKSLSQDSNPVIFYYEYKQ